MIETRRLLTEALPTVLIGALGAALFWLVGFPAAVLTGPAAVVSIATLMGFRSYVPKHLRETVFVIIGISIGSTVSPEVIETALAWPVSLAALSVTLVLIVLIVRSVLVRGFGFDRMTAMLAATPGHLSYVMGLSSELGADVSRVALAQSVRVLLLTLTVPVLIALWGAEGTGRLPDEVRISVLAAAIVFALSLACGALFARFGIPAPLLLGSMAVSAVGHGSGLTPGTLPPWLTIFAFIVMGSLIGTRFRGMGLAGLFDAIAAGVVATLVACLVAALGAVLAARVVDIPPAALLLAFAPGGVEVMAALAVETGLEPAFVAAHHVFRLILLSILIPVFLARERRV